MIASMEKFLLFPFDDELMKSLFDIDVELFLIMFPHFHHRLSNIVMMNVECHEKFNSERCLTMCSTRKRRTKNSFLHIETWEIYIESIRCEKGF